ncbi:MAG: DUF3160 domain-containing protein [Paludibacteraceae bacterium]|nr:DUF3160 domain-containing protein [Paludibacteraceae bacterium]
MRKPYLASILVSALTFASCGSETNTSNTNTDSRSDSITVSEKQNKGGQDSLLIDDLDYDMDLSKLSYNDLYLLLHYPYAKHAFWFKEPELNHRYTNIRWYNDLIDVTYYTQDEYRMLREDLDKTYWKRWIHDYDKLKAETKLDPKEKEFVTRVRARMAELEKEKHVKVDGVNICNPNFIVNSNPSKDAELFSLLKRNGFALQKTDYTQLFQIYDQNDYDWMPNYVTTDVMLQLFNHYNRFVLDAIEEEVIVPNLQKMCEGLYKRSKEIADTLSDAKLKEIADFSTTYYAIALSLLKGEKYDVPESMKNQYVAELELIDAAVDELSPLLGTTRYFNYSLFKPRAQYTRTEASKRYFRGMMWLQSAYLCAENDGLEKALFMAKVYDDSDNEIKDAVKNAFKPIDYLMGEPNDVPILELASKLNDWSIFEFKQLLDQNIMDKASSAITEATKGKSCIKPQIQITCQPKINFMPQRYVPDGDILNMMADTMLNAERAYPRGVDVFDAFGIKAAKALNDTFFTDNKAWNNYEKQRKKASDKFRNFSEWNKTGYNKWLQMLMVLQNPDKNYPGYMHTSSWQLKNLNTALASWSELKHNSVLYTKQPIAAECGDGGEDELPEPMLLGYVEPNIKFWKTLKEAVSQTYDLAEKSGFKVDKEYERKREDDYIVKSRTLKSVTKPLLEMIDFFIKASDKELEGKTLTYKEYERLRYIGGEIESQTLSLLCNRWVYEDWSGLTEVDKKIPVVADIYTRNVPDCQKNGILHTAVGRANRIYVTVEINGHFYLTCGATLSYYEFINNSRLTDEEWQGINSSVECPKIPDWMAPLMLSSDKNNYEDHKYFTYGQYGHCNYVPSFMEQFVH